MTKIKNKNVLITGGANGIGKLLGERCLKEGAANLIIWDINEDLLNQTAEEFADLGFDNVHPYILDVTDTDYVEAAAKMVLKDVGPVDILFNNAGVVAGKKFFHEHSAKDIDLTIGVNVLGVMHVARVFLPQMIAQQRGHIINISSAAGLVPNPNMSVYASSKWAVLGWSESLRIELESISKRLRVTTVTPSYISTGMFKGVKTPRFTPEVKPEDMVSTIIKAVKKNKIILRSPNIVYALPILRGILPTRVFDFIGGKLFGIYKTMDTFEGRAKNKIGKKKSLLDEVGI